MADENTCRKPFDPFEAVEIGKAIEAAYKPVAEAKKAEGRKAGGGDRRSDAAKRSRATCPQAKQDETARTTAVAAGAPEGKRTGRPKSDRATCPSTSKPKSGRGTSPSTSKPNPFRILLCYPLDARAAIALARLELSRLGVVEVLPPLLRLPFPASFRVLLGPFGFVLFAFRGSSPRGYAAATAVVRTG